MAVSKKFLIAGGMISAMISTLHIVRGMNPMLYGVIAPGQVLTLSEMAEQSSSLIMILSFVIALIFAIWAIYAFSGAGWLRPLPLLRTGLVVIGIIYILRSLFMPSEINMVLNEGYPFRFVLYSALSFVAGLLYLLGRVKMKSQGQSKPS